MRGAGMRGAELRLPTRTASARRVRPFLRERERPVRSTAVPGGLRARVPCHAAAQRAALGLRSPRARAPCSRPLRGRRRAERARSCSPSPSGSRRRRLCVQQRPPSTRNAPRLRNAERPLRPGASRPLQRRGVCGGRGLAARARAPGRAAGWRPSRLHTRVRRAAWSPRSLRQSWRGPQALRLLPQPSRATGSALRCHFRDPQGSPVGRGSASLARPSLARRSAPP